MKIVVYLNNVVLELKDSIRYYRLSAFKTRKRIGPVSRGEEASILSPKDLVLEREHAVRMALAYRTAARVVQSELRRLQAK